MAFLTVVKQWVENIWRVELDTRWAGGEDGTANIQAKQIAARTEYLKEFADEVKAARETEGSLLDRIKKTGVEPMNIMAKFAFIEDEPLVASTENVDVTNGGLIAMDGINLAVGNLVLLKDQEDKKQNGFWEVQTGAWNRFAGYQGADLDCFTNKLISVKSGDANVGKVFFLNKDVYTIDVSDLSFVESIFSSRARAGKVLLWDQKGESDIDDKMGAADLNSAVEQGRNLLEVFKVSTTVEAMAEIRRRCNNNGEIDNTKNPDFKGIMIGDYLDLPSLNDGTTNYVWNENYKNLRILVSGFNIYKGAADNENIENHILFSFRNCPLTRQMNTTDTNVGGYAASAMKTYLDGVFANGLKQALGGNFLLPVRRLLSTSDTVWAWNENTVFLPTEYEIWCAPVWSHVGHGGGFQCQWPIFRETVYKGKKCNGSRQWYYTASQKASSASVFCIVGSLIHAGHSTTASVAGGVAPGFCVR